MNTTVQIKVADEVWIATALLQREFPDRDFSTREILDEIRSQGLTPSVRAGISAHISQHCVANRVPNTGRYRMLYATVRSRRRLYRPGDAYHPDRTGSKITPKREEIPSKYHHLLDWFYSTYAKGGPEGGSGDDPILSLRGLGKSIWNEDPDEYVRRLREEWD